MSTTYQAVGWNRQKRLYDGVLAAGVAAYLVVFVAGNLLFRPHATLETILIRALGTAALLLLHVVLAIGPLCRLDPRFLPLLYNRRHLGRHHVPPRPRARRLRPRPVPRRRATSTRFVSLLAGNRRWREPGRLPVPAARLRRRW